MKMLSDAHMHLDRCEPEQLRQFVEEARKKGVAATVAASMNVESSVETIAIGNSFDIIYPAVGIHPWNATNVDQKLYNELRELASHKGVVAISEIGLDFARNAAAHDVQEQAFA